VTIQDLLEDAISDSPDGASMPQPRGDTDSVEIDLRKANAKDTLIQIENPSADKRVVGRIGIRGPLRFPLTSSGRFALQWDVPRLVRSILRHLTRHGRP
jgi:hypothetical protein